MSKTTHTMVSKKKKETFTIHNLSTISFQPDMWDKFCPTLQCLVTFENKKLCNEILNLLRLEESRRWNGTFIKRKGTNTCLTRFKKCKYTPACLFFILLIQTLQRGQYNQLTDGAKRPSEIFSISIFIFFVKLPNEFTFLIF